MTTLSPRHFCEGSGTRAYARLLRSLFLTQHNFARARLSLVRLRDKISRTMRCRRIGTFDLQFEGGRVMVGAQVFTCFFVFLAGPLSRPSW